MDNNATSIRTDKSSGSTGDWIETTDQTALPDPTWDIGGRVTTGTVAAIYALTDGGSTGNDLQLNIGDDWKTMDAMQINIGDSWKAVEGVQVNIGDSWKEVFKD